MHKKPVLLGLAASGAITLGAFAATVPASAASLTSSTASTHSSTSAVSLSPASVGSILCSGDLCIQRVTSIVNGKATVKAWAFKTSFRGYFALTDGDLGDYDQESPTEQWTAGGAGYLFTNVPQAGNPYTASAWTSPTNPIGWVYFGI
jgi:hypothetical protein